MRAAIHMSGSPAKASGKFVIKEILRTGEWPVIPTRAGIVKKPLRVVATGKSDETAGIISLSEVVANFKAKAIERPQIPLTDDDDDHKNLTRLNTGFVRDLWVEDRPDGAVLVAKMEITEPTIREKILNGSIADVSAGIPWRVVSRGRVFGTTLEHVALTNRPFIDNLSGFSLAASIPATVAQRAERTREALHGTRQDDALRERVQTARSALRGSDDSDVRQRAAEVRATLRGGR